MNDNMLDPTCIEAPEPIIRADLLISAVLHLMSNYSANKDTNGSTTRGCSGLALVIERHLKTLATLPTLAPVLQATCQQLSEQWEVVVKQTLPKPEKLPVFRHWLMSQKINPI